MATSAAGAAGGPRNAASAPGVAASSGAAAAPGAVASSGNATAPSAAPSSGAATVPPGASSRGPAWAAPLGALALVAPVLAATLGTSATSLATLADRADVACGVRPRRRRGRWARGARRCSRIRTSARPLARRVAARPADARPRRHAEPPAVVIRASGSTGRASSRPAPGYEHARHVARLADRRRLRPRAAAQGDLALYLSRASDDRRPRRGGNWRRGPRPRAREGVERAVTPATRCSRTAVTRWTPSRRP